jgi:hypothetical protein
MEDLWRLETRRAFVEPKTPQTRLLSAIRGITGSHRGLSVRVPRHIRDNLDELARMGSTPRSKA